MPIINNLIQINSRNITEIEKVLDELLDFTTDKNILKLFKNLCRYYYSIDPVTASEYVFIYKKMWDHSNPTEDTL
jgi:hypothetical protein